MLLAITVLELSSGQTDKQTDKQTNKRDRKHYLSDFIGGGKYLIYETDIYLVDIFGLLFFCKPNSRPNILSPNDSKIFFKILY